MKEAVKNVAGVRLQVEAVAPCPSIVVECTERKVAAEQLFFWMIYWHGKGLLRSLSTASRGVRLHRLAKVARVEIGEYDGWETSDHRPIAVEIGM